MVHPVADRLLSARQVRPRIGEQNTAAALQQSIILICHGVRSE